jgi:hypothetical protein
MDDSIPNELVFKFLNSPQYRTLHVDGAFGGVTSRGLINLSLYSEHPYIPSKVTYQFNQNGTSQELRREPEIPDASVIREIEVSAILDLQVAKSIRDWLDGNIKILEQIIQETPRGTS